jgi:hypothetical protein
MTTIGRVVLLLDLQVNALFELLSTVLTNVVDTTI